MWIGSLTVNGSWVDVPNNPYLMWGWSSFVEEVKILQSQKEKKMIMIAFITINSGLVPLIEGLCAQIYYLRFEIIGGLRSHLLLFFFERKICSRKKQLVQDLIPPPSIYIHMCTFYTYTNTHMPRFGPSGFFGLSRCLISTPGLTSE